MFPPQNGSGRAQHADSANKTAGSETRAARVPAVYKAFKLLETVSVSDRPLGVSELARRLRMGKSTVHGLVTTLEALGVLETVGLKRYALGPRLNALLSRTGNQADLRQVARPALERLAANTELTSFLGVPSDSQITILDIVHGPPTLAISAQVGSSIPLLAGAVGKVVVASWEDGRRQDFLRDTVLPAFTDHSIVKSDEYESAVRQTLGRGVAIDCDEYVDGVRAAAAPVTGPGQRLLAIVWVAGFSRHIDDARLGAVASAVLKEATEISRRLGVTSPN